MTFRNLTFWVRRGQDAHTRVFPILFKLAKRYHKKANVALSRKMEIWEIGSSDVSISDPGEYYQDEDDEEPNDNDDDRDSPDMEHFEQESRSDSEGPSGISIPWLSWM